MAQDHLNAKKKKTHFSRFLIFAMRSQSGLMEEKLTLIAIFSIRKTFIQFLISTLVNQLMLKLVLKLSQYFTKGNELRRVLYFRITFNINTLP